MPPCGGASATVDHARCRFHGKLVSASAPHPAPPDSMKRFLALLLTLIAAQAYAIDWQESDAVASLFKERKLHGTFVLYDVSGNRLIGYNRTRGQIRYIPDTTFDIPNSLIGFAAGSVANVEQILPYGGGKQPFKAWEQDMSLRNANKISNNAVFQEMARRTGLAPMRNGVTALQYGNERVGNFVDKFWLEGPLKISAFEQVDFLARFGQLKLPLSRFSLLSVRAILFLEYGDNWALYGKTGWASNYKPGIGWWVGWMQKGEDIYAFALNVDMPDASDESRRVEFGKACLKALGVLPADHAGKTSP